MWKLVERQVPDFVEVARPNIIQIVWCWECVQFSQVISVLILEAMKSLILQNYWCAFLSVFFNPHLTNVPILYSLPHENITGF